ncbi:outer membrane beta-barrel protein [Sphingomonas sp.]|uniref:outer membrane protein n=1 Tax=Sphingomonas sp. TaxID=28214 RepID=UPI0025E28A6D|nr:outer membrane beta-barrel protein [Sphingomonas sp.]
MKSVLVACAFTAWFAIAPARAQELKHDFHLDALVGTGVGEDRVDNNVKGGASVGYDLRTGGVVLGAEAEFFDAASLGVRVGAALPGGTLLYVKGGYATTRVTIYAPGGTLLDRRWIDGGRVGAGVQFPISRKLSLKGEYRYTNYELGLESHQLAAGLGFHF